MTQIPPHVQVDISDHDGGVTVAVQGDLDLAGAPEFSTAVARLDDRAPGQEVTVDLTGVGFCDSAGISALVALRQRCDGHRWLLRTIGAQPAVRRILVDFTGLGEFLNVA
jgi:anti-sigma B factor antagonist